MVEFFLDGRAVLVTVMVVCGVDGKFFETSELIENVLDAAICYSEKRLAVFHIFNILIESADLDAHLFADGIFGGSITSTVQFHSRSGFFQILGEL